MFVETLRLKGEDEVFTIDAQAEFRVLSTEYWVDAMQTTEVEEEVHDDPWQGATRDEQKTIEDWLLGRTTSSAAGSSSSASASSTSSHAKSAAKRKAGRAKPAE